MILSFRTRVLHKVLYIRFLSIFLRGSEIQTEYWVKQEEYNNIFKHFTFQLRVVSSKKPEFSRLSLGFVEKILKTPVAVMLNMLLTSGWWDVP